MAGRRNRRPIDAARDSIGDQYPQKKSAVLPLLHLAQDQEGQVTPDAIEEIADLLDLTPALVLGTCSFYTMFKREPVGKLLVSVCTNVSCLVNGGPDLLEHLRAALRGRLRRHGRRGRVHRRVRPRPGAAGQLRVPRPRRRARRRGAGRRVQGGQAGGAHDLRVPGCGADRWRARDRASSPSSCSERPDDSWTIDAALGERRVRGAEEGARHDAARTSSPRSRRRVCAVAAAPASAPARSGRSCPRTCSRATSR